MPKLPAIGWTKREDLAALVAAIGADNLRWVGGAVRDTLLNLPAVDIDAATTLLPEDTIAALKSAGIRVVPTGLDHGTVTAVLGDGSVEITTLRKDVGTDGRRATVAFAQEWQDDAARRDFTINALYAHPETLEISDYFGGLDDLRDRRVRFIGNAQQRIREDHLRILRYYRFQARFGSALDDEAEEACKTLASTLKGLSRERVSNELLAILDLENPQLVLARMQESGVLPVILPEASDEGFQRLATLVANENASEFAQWPLRRLAALLPPDPALRKQVASRLRLSNTQKKHLIRLAQIDDMPVSDAAQARALAYREGKATAIDRLLMTGGDPEPLCDWDIPELPLKGGEIVARGVEAGPEVARILQTVESRWIEEGFPGSERVQQFLDEELRH